MHKDDKIEDKADRVRGIAPDLSDEPIEMERIDKATIHDIMTVRPDTVEG
jgi:hypothetical protein